MNTLDDIDFVDLVIGQGDDGDAYHLSGVPGTVDPMPAPASVIGEVKKIQEICIAERNKLNGKIEFPIVFNKRRYRVAFVEAQKQKVFILRRMPLEVPELTSLNIRPGSVIEHLMRKGLTGMVVISGAFGQGKTTTASAYIRERLKKYGGIAFTIEDPPEMPLEGRHGDGHCYQTWADSWADPKNFANACKKLARYAPSIIFLGEIRDPDTATEAFSAAINGKLVVCTTHADDIPSTVERLINMAASNGKNVDDMASFFASGLTAIVHQKLIRTQNGRIPEIKFLWVGDQRETAIRGHIRKKEYPQLENEIQLWANLNKLNIAR